MYPNPLKGNQLNIDIPIGNEEVEVRLTGIDGKVLYQQMMQVLNNNIQINNLNAKPGVYLVTLNSSKGSITKQLLIE